MAERGWASTRIDAPRALAAAIVLGVGLRLALAWSGWCDRGLICDDAYYGFRIARHIAAGRGSTFDGVHPTNGYHPLNVWLAVPFYWLWPSDPWLPIHAMLSLYAALDACTALLLWRALVRLGMPKGGLACGVAWMLWPGVFLLTLRGCEASVAACLVAWLLWLETVPQRRLRHHVLSGIASGLVFLARTDVALLLVAFHLHHMARRAKAGRGLAAEARGVFAIVLPCAAAVAAPWVVWNVVRFGTALQTSGLVKRQLYTAIGALPGPAQASSLAAWLVTNPWLLVRDVVGFTVGEEFAAKPSVAPWATAAVLALALGAVVVCLRSRRSLWRWHGWSVVWGVAYVAVYAYYMRYYWSWYFAVPLVVWLPWLGGAADWACAHRRGVGVALAAVFVAASATQLALFYRGVPPSRADDEDRLRPLYRLVDRLAAPGAVVGSWNSGAFGYFASFHSRAVWVNLDGVVNNDAFVAARSGRYAEWLVSYVDMIVERPRWASPFVSKAEFAAMAGEFVPVSSRPLLALNRRLMPGALERIEDPR